MPLGKKNIWIMVGNGSIAKIYQNRGSKRNITLVQEVSSEAAHLPSRELGDHKPGRTFTSANAARHAVEPRSDPHRKEKTHFAHYVASLLNEGASAKKFDKLMLISSPEFLGDIRAELSKFAYESIQKEINKDLTHMGKEDILSYIF